MYINHCVEKAQKVGSALVESVKSTATIPYYLITTTLESLSNQTVCKDAGFKFKRACLAATGLPAVALLVLVNSDGTSAVDGVSTCNEFATTAFNQYARECSESSSTFKKHVVSRVANFGVMLLSIVSRVVDIAIGVISLPFALITLGKLNKLNAYATLGFAAIGGIVSDLVLGVLNTLNPKLNVETREQCGLNFNGQV